MNDELERMIATHGLAHVLDAIADVCAEASQRIATSYEPSVLSRAWERAGNIVRRTSRSAVVWSITP